MFSDAATDNTLLDTTTQAQFAASAPALGSASTARLTIIGAAELEVLRKNNRILRSNNISIMRLKGEMEERMLAAEEKVKVLERELRRAKDAKMKEVEMKEVKVKEEEEGEEL